MGPIDILRSIVTIATACHLSCADWIKSNDIVSTHVTSTTSQGHRERRSVKVQLTKQEIDELVRVHNVLRAGEGASNMELMTWNHKLAEMGQLWAETCLWKHGQPQYNNPPYKQIGQNLWAHEAGANMTSAIYAFWEEKKFFNYNKLECQEGQMCGHYTQVVWAASKEVGCGLVTCSTLSYLKHAAYLVCNYGPPGNFNGQKPFLIGPPCSQCGSGRGWCVNGLCTDTCRGKSNCECAAICKNCATVKKSSCSCECDYGWTGTDCSETCENRDSRCGGNPGWPVSWCKGNQFSAHVTKSCPLMCNICRAGRPNHSKCAPEGEGPGLTYKHDNDINSLSFNGGTQSIHRNLPQYFTVVVIAALSKIGAMLIYS